MNCIIKTANSSGAYPPIQYGIETLPEGYAEWPNSLSTDDFYKYNGFVTLTIEPHYGVDRVTNYTPNVEAWKEWKATLPPEEEPEPTADDILNAMLGVTTNE